MCSDKSLNCRLKLKQNEADKKSQGSSSSRDAASSPCPHLRATQPAGGQSTCSPSIRRIKQPLPEMMQRPNLFEAQKMDSISKTTWGSHLDYKIELEWENCYIHVGDASPDVNRCSPPNHGSHRRAARALLQEVPPPLPHICNETSHGLTEEIHQFENLGLVQSTKLNISQNLP